ncbi:MAG: sensor protein [Candidatus Angelobacter sp.]|nr:sensor protein [Candidatus Angelobacter sp.]
MLAVVVLLTAAVLILLQLRMLAHVREDVASTLQAESVVYKEIEQGSRTQAQQSAMLIADQPSVKALMSTNDRLTVQDGSEQFLKTSNADLLILEGASGEVLGFHSKSEDVLVSGVKRFLQESSGKQDWWFAGGHLFDVSFAPIVSGAGPEVHQLGRIALAREVSPQLLGNTAVFGNSILAFESGGKVLQTSLSGNARSEFENWLVKGTTSAGTLDDVQIGGERYFAHYLDLPGEHPIRLYFLRSYDQATAFLRQLNRILLTLGGIAILIASLVVFALSKQITAPLENLAAVTKRMEEGDFEFELAAQGTDEVAQLTRSFEQMRVSIRNSREGMLRTARLEAVGRLAGGVAHDFNNLVTIISGYSDLLLDTADAKNRPYVEEIKNAGQRATALTRQLLAFSRKQVLEPQVLDPNQTVRNMVKMLRVLIGEDIELATNLSEQIGRVLVDAGQLEQVIMNLAVNARDAMPKGGRIIIETTHCDLDETYAEKHTEVTAGPYVLLSVTDTGSGISGGTLAHIFEPFFTTKEAGKGTGLGLATVYGIVKQSKGHIAVYSELGVGTVFKVYLPSLDKTIPVASAQQSGAIPRGEGTILLVEDEPALRVLAAESLKRLGYKVLQAGNGLEALALADRQASSKIDVVLTDVVMPRMGGPALIAQLREKRNDFAVIFMSGYSDTAVLEFANLGTESLLLQKPFTTEALARKISEAQSRTGSS